MESTELTKDSFIESELQRFETNLEITKEGLVTLANSVKDLIIKDTEDKEGLKAVIEGRKLLKSKRVLIQKESKRIRESAVRFQKAMIAREGEFVELLEPTETLLESREQEYYEERARLDAAKEKQESDRIQAMIDKLNAVNYAVDFHELKALTDVQFENILAEATTKYNVALEEEKAEKQRQYELRLQEETRLAQAQKEQEEREEKFRQEQEAFRKQQEEAQRKVNEENDRIRKEHEAKEKELAARQREIELQEKERLEAARKEQQEKAEVERKKVEGADRKKREKEAKEQALLFGEDVDRFEHISKSINAILVDPVFGAMKSLKGIDYAGAIQEHLQKAKILSDANLVSQDNV